MIVISDYEASKLRMASEIVKKTDDRRVVLLSDALYLLYSADFNEIINGMLMLGATFYALDVDVSRRGLSAGVKHFTTMTYDEFVVQLMKNSGGIINL